MASEICAIHAYKHDGNLYKSIEKHICIYESTKCWIFFLPPYQTELVKEVTSAPSQGTGDRSSRMRSYSQCTNEHPVFWFFWKDHWFNILLTLKPSSKQLYLSISTPPLLEEKAFKYLDFDLDLRVDNSSGNLELLNSDEYVFNCTKMRYSDNLKKEVSKTIREVFTLLKGDFFKRLTSDEKLEELWKKVTEVTGKSKEEFLSKKLSEEELGNTELVEFD
ncbi:hypothetical protein MHLP_01445 [Candidatus Mycoplasma haematolamae str. Purdue]|uniref:DUF402 domain-containing protein n=1 Tax=Mycoplasma haematolamae (strain Purdue) TaxID=1212765 RepID=I7CJ17_MYCHA|nr:DUF402 domain-containing protein [Candidatus Mycoplasma haematolamae]AFO51869.1 hypothetical protein MHLP_01445 [Candidatus Mycoplasma haematolamae str. Purdue]